MHKAKLNTQISWVYTEDLDVSAAFYGDTLGFECIRHEGNARIYRTCGDAGIGVCQVFADRVVEPKGGMITLVTDDVDGWYQSLVGKGVAIAKPPHRLEQFGIYTFFIEDPNGYVLEIQQFDR